jgi:cell fate regulator YaaT (PSP1 superfamily)
MKSCRIRLDRLTGVVEMEVPEDIKVGDHVVGEIEKGACLGVVISEPEETKRAGLKKITRKATESEVSDFFALKEKEAQALAFCKSKIREMNLPMKLLWAEYLLGGSKLLFYFVSENRVDFRELVKELAKEFKVRIELRQVGVRDEAKIVGGLGNCGNVCCCGRFLNNFSIVSIKMVKEQSLALNPAKISGICGRLMCCLSYEFDMYMECKKDFPKVGKKVTLAQGQGKVIKHNTLSSTITVELEDGKEVTVQLKDIIRPEQQGKP